MDTRLIIVGDTPAAGYDWQDRIRNFIVTNCAVAGNTSAKLLQSLPEIKKKCPRADILMLSIGTTDMKLGNQNFPNTIIDIGKKMLSGWPASELLLTSLFPCETGAYTLAEIEKINKHISNTAVHIGGVYMDVYTPMMRAIEAKQQLFSGKDTLLTDDGWNIWARVLLEHIAFLVEDDD